MARILCFRWYDCGCQIMFGRMQRLCEEHYKALIRINMTRVDMVNTLRYPEYAKFSEGPMRFKRRVIGRG